MKTLKNILKNKVGLFFLSIGLIGLSACSNNPTNVNTPPTQKQPSQQDIQLANDVLSQTLASNSDGLMSSIYDLTGTITPSGFKYDSQGSTNIGINNVISGSPATGNNNDKGSNGDNGNSGDNGNNGKNEDNGNSERGHDSNFKISYNPQTGVHTVEFQRALNTPKMQKSLHLKLEYIFRDTLGLYLQFPSPSRIESIDYKGLREGKLKTPHKSSQFSRIDTLYFSGLQDNSNTLTINGSHNASGEIAITSGSDTTMHKRYNISLKLINVTINKDSLYHNNNLENALTGVLNYKLKILQVNDSTKVDQNFKGTINLSGNGYALLKFVSFPKMFLINLQNGAIKQDNS